MEPSTLALMNHRNIGKAKFECTRVLFDSGSTKSIILKHFVCKCCIQKDNRTKFNARGGTCTTHRSCTTQFYFPEFNNKKGVEFKPMVDSATNPEDNCHDMTVGGDTMDKLGMDICHSSNAIEWGEDRQSGSIPMKT